MALLALVVPVVSEGLRLASLAGELSQRKTLAMRIADRVLNETIITGQWNQTGRGANEQSGAVTYKWTLHNDPWIALNSTIPNTTPNGITNTFVNPNNLHVLTVDVSFPAHGQTYAVHLSTVVDITKQIAANTPPKQ